MSKEFYIDNFRLTAYRAAAEKVMQIADDRERMQQIGRLVSKILTERPLMKQCVGMLYYRYYPNMETKTPHNPQDRSIKLRWNDYRAYYDNPDEGLLNSWMGNYVDEDIVNKWKNEPVPDPPEWLDEFEPPFDENGNIVGDSDHITELTALLDALQTEYDLLAAVNSLTQDTNDTAAGNDSGGSNNPLTRHFYSPLTDAVLTAIHNDLIKHKYLAPDTDLKAWLWVCAGKGEKAPTEPLKWIAEQNKLGAFTDWLCWEYRETTDWKTMEKCFVCKDAETGNYMKPNTKAIKQRKIADEEKTKLKNLLITAKFNSKK